jgi:serine/threonine protein kinase
MSEESSESLERAIEVFGEFCNLTTDEQEKRLKHLEEMDIDLAGQVRELLRAERDADERLDDGALGQLSSEAALKLTGETDAFAAQMMERLAKHGGSFKRYEIQTELARGGQGAVLRIFDEVLDRHLAMKVILGHGRAEVTGRTPGVNTKALGRFLDEAHVTGKLDHPGIVPLHDLGIDTEGRAYFTMKLVKGKTLMKVFDELAKGKGGWTQVRVLGLILKVCEAMSYAHAKGVIHRDLKPSNVMVGRYGEVYVMDWGLAKILGREDDKDIRVRPESLIVTSDVRRKRRDQEAAMQDSPITTMDGDVVGTPAYMSPEQAAGRVSEMGPPSDVYALGAMLYHLIAGHMPYVPPGARLNNYAVWGLVQAGPPSPAENAASEAPAELVAICERAMKRELNDRYADMSALADDLSAYIEGRVVRAYEAGGWAEARKWVRRNTSLAAALATVLMVAVGGLGGIGYVQAEGRAAERVERERADRNAQEAEGNLALARQNEVAAQEQRAIADQNATIAQEQRARAELNEDIAREETARVLRLSDVKLLQELEGSADDLWPAHPDVIQSIADWLDRADTLMSRLPVHRSTLDEMRQSAEVAYPGDTWTFSETADQWQHDVLAELVHGLVDLQSGLLAPDAIIPQHGWSIPKRISAAQALAAGFGEEGKHAEAWSNALPAIRKVYPGLDLEPQMGLVPVGPDPESGLWEFWHVLSGGRPDGALSGFRMTEESGVIFVLLPGGEFSLEAEWLGEGARDSKVVLSPFFISKYELTHAQSQDPGHDAGLTIKGGVTANEATLLLKRLGLRLPTANEFLYSAKANRSGTWLLDHRDEFFDFADGGVSDSGHISLSKTMSNNIKAPGCFAPNPFGLHEMVGNAFEFAAEADLTTTLFFFSATEVSCVDVDLPSRSTITSPMMSFRPARSVH